ncbi:MAG: type II CAAX prenyl endopeptidase Rce1 family protein [Chlorobiota bacterium]
MSIRIYIILIFSLVSLCKVTSNTLDHEIFIEKLRNSSEVIYEQCIAEYDTYLEQHPDDVKVLIEKCKFIQNAQYDEYNDYNPNQDQFDSLIVVLAEKYPSNPDVLLYRTTLNWGDELNELFTESIKAITKNPENWSDEQLGLLYSKISEYYYWDEDYSESLSYIRRAINKAPQYEFTLEHAQILYEMDQKEKSLEIVLSIKDTNREPWVLSQKAELMLKLEAYNEAFSIYTQIAEIDSNFNNNYEIANTLEAIGKYDFARSYLIADTTNTWYNEGPILNLLQHDIKYQDGDKCIQTYNSYRDLGYSVDPLGLYRIKIFFKSPILPWKFRDILSILTFLFVIAILLIIPSIWILPVYFAGHHFNFLERNKAFRNRWGLKSFWIVSVGVLISSLFSVFVNPEILYSDFITILQINQFEQQQNAMMSLIFIIVLAIFAFSTLNKKNCYLIYSSSLSKGKTILLAIGIVFGLRIIIGAYVNIGSLFVDISSLEIANITEIVFSTKEEIESMLSYFGVFPTFLLICILVPIYEEIIFRGVILDSCEKYINYKWANFIQAFLFAMLHQSLFLFPMFFLFGIIAGVMTRKTKGLFASIIFHMINNTLVIIAYTSN